jgi:hypothetical protein
MIGPSMTQSTNAASFWCAGANDIDNNPTGKGTREFAQRFIGCANEFGEQRKCLVGVVAKCVGKCFFIEDANLRRNLLKRFVLFHLSA